MVKVKKEVVKKEKKVVPKLRNGGTMTESGFWSFIRSALRNKSRFWIPIQEAKKLARRKSKSSNKRLKFEYQCSECKGWFPDKEVSVDHIVPASSLNCANDLPGFIERLFCEMDNLAVLCEKTCHAAKTKIDREQLKLNKKENV